MASWAPVMSEEILAESEAVLERVKQDQHFTAETGPWLDTLRTSALWVTPVPFEEKVCRDPKDDKFIEAALAAGARTVIAHQTMVMHRPTCLLAGLGHGFRKPLAILVILKNSLPPVATI